MYSHRFLRKAQHEYEAAVECYLDRSVPAAVNFVQEVEYVLEQICAHPYRWRNQFEDYYELGLKKYPFSIIYRVEDDNKIVIITAVYHQSSNPGTKYL